MKNKFALSLLAACVVILLGAVGSTTVSYFKSTSISQTNYVAEELVTNGITLGGVRNTAWPAGGTGWSTNAAVSDVNMAAHSLTGVVQMNVGTLVLTNNLLRTATLATATTNIVVDYQYSDLYIVTSSNMTLTAFGTLPASGNTAGTTLTIVANGTSVNVTNSLGAIKIANSSVAFPVIIPAGGWGTFAFKSYGSDPTNNAVAYAVSQ